MINDDDDFSLSDLNPDDDDWTNYIQNFNNWKNEKHKEQQERREEMSDDDMMNQIKIHNMLQDAGKFRIAINARTDNTIKEIGDRVIIWDSSSLINIDTDKVVYGENIQIAVANYPSIVISKNETYKLHVDGLHPRFDRLLDLIVWNPQLKLKFRIPSTQVKIYEQIILK